MCKYKIVKKGLPFEPETTEYSTMLFTVAVTETEEFFESNSLITREDLVTKLKGYESGVLIILCREDNLFTMYKICNEVVTERNTPYVSELSIKEMGKEFFMNQVDELTMEQLTLIYPNMDIDGAISDLSTHVSENEETSSLECFMKDVKVEEYEKMTIKEFRETFSFVFDKDSLRDYGI